MKSTIVLSIFSTSLLAVFGAEASETTELTVTGTIRPNACQITFPSDNTINFGTIKADMQLQEEYKELPTHNVALQINCDGPTKLAVRVSDNRGQSYHADARNADPTSNFGLGTYRGKNIGNYTVDIDSAIADGNATDILIRAGRRGERYWTNDLTRRFRHDGGQFSFGNNRIPVAFNSLTATLAVATRLNKDTYLEMADAIQLDGSLSLELIYL